MISRQVFVFTGTIRFHQGERFYQIPRVCCDGTGLFDVIYTYCIKEMLYEVRCLKSNEDLHLTYCIVKGLEKKMKDKTIVTAFRPVVTETE